MTEISTTQLTTRNHFEILDGLRGIAAIAVVIFHFMELIAPDYQDNFIAHAYLAVDFFFCLSGFVIAYAYDQKLPKIGIRLFLTLRLIRLHPLVIVGSILGLLSFVFDPFSNLHRVYADRTLIMFVTSCLMIPYPVVGERFLNLFHLNPPTWTLFWEYVANLLYAFVFVNVRNKVLWGLTAIAAGVLLYQARQATYLGVVGFSGDTFWGGGIRALYPFLAGLLVYRSQWIIRSSLGFISVGFLLLITFLIPCYKPVNWFVDSGLVIFYFPFLIALGAGARLEATFTKACRFLGQLSYPLYMTHYPFIWLVLSYMEVKKPPISQLVLITVTGVFLLIAFAYLVMRTLDTPIRNQLKRALVRKG